MVPLYGVQKHYVSTMYKLVQLILPVQDGHTALYFASDNGHEQVVELLLRREADVNHQTKVRLR